LGCHANSHSHHCKAGALLKRLAEFDCSLLISSRFAFLSEWVVADNAVVGGTFLRGLYARFAVKFRDDDFELDDPLF
jgi:hypothetical protein